MIQKNRWDCPLYKPSILRDTSIYGTPHVSTMFEVNVANRFVATIVLHAEWARIQLVDEAC
jgi:hypothetical protein